MWNGKKKTIQWGIGILLSLFAVGASECIIALLGTQVQSTKHLKSKSSINAGEYIGIVGATGSKNNIHLDITVFDENNRRVDPLRLFPFDDVLNMSITDDLGVNEY